MLFNHGKELRAFCPLLRPNSESYFSQISVDNFIRRIAQVLKSGIYLTFTIAIVPENGCQNRLKSRNDHFGPNMRL